MSDQDIALMAHLMRRAGFGATRDELETRVAKGYEATVEELLSTEEQEELDRNEMMRYHPWAWRPGTLPGMGAAEWLHDLVVTNEAGDRRLDSRVPFLFVGHVQMHVDRVASGLGNLGRHGGAFLVQHVGQHDLGAFLGEQPGFGSALTSGRSGD